MAQIRLRLREADGGLPNVCLCCGQEATVTKDKTLSWFPRWVIVLLFVNILLYAIVASIMTKKARLQAPLCDEHKGHWFKRGLLMWGTFFLFGLLGVGGFVIAGNLPRPNDDYMGIACAAGAVFFVIWLVIVVVAQYTAIRPSEITDEEIVLKGVSQEFVDAVEESDRHRPMRSRRSRDDEDDDEPRPRKKRPASDGFEE